MKIIFVMGCFLLVLVSKAQDPKSVPKGEIDIIMGVKIKMRDGVRLNATLYKPRQQKEPLPVIFSMTPYISDNLHERGVYFAKHDYVYAAVDVRGRGNSEGEFEPIVNEAKDGYDVAEWIAKQPYCNGKTAMWGGSYVGYTQWATAKELPPHLKTIVPVASPKPGLDFMPVQNFPWPGSFLSWLVLTGLRTQNEKLLSDREYWNSKYRERVEKDLPLAVMDSLVGFASKAWKNYLAHPTYDAYYKNMNPDSVQYSKMKLPILTITGQYDGNQKGAIGFYNEYFRYASADAKQNHFLIIGPWDHAGTRVPTKTIYAATFGDSALLDMNHLHWQWYNYALKDSAKPPFLRDKVMYYVANRDQWKSASLLEEIGKAKMKFYLNSGQPAGRVDQDSAVLQMQVPETSKPAQYTYDPLNEKNTTNLAYYTPAFEQDIEVSGFFQLDTYIETNVKDVDVHARIFIIKADGTRIPMSNSSIQRARFREGLEKEKLLVPGKIHLWRFKSFSFVSWIIEKGSRLCLTLHSPNDISLAKNYCSGGNVAYETSKDAKVATLKVYNDREHSSVLYVPVAK